MHKRCSKCDLVIVFCCCFSSENEQKQTTTTTTKQQTGSTMRKKFFAIWNWRFCMEVRIVSDPTCWQQEQLAPLWKHSSCTSITSSLAVSLSVFACLFLHPTLSCCKFFDPLLNLTWRVATVYSFITFCIKSDVFLLLLVCVYWVIFHAR